MRLLTFDSNRLLLHASTSWAHFDRPPSRTISSWYYQGLRPSLNFRIRTHSEMPSEMPSIYENSYRFHTEFAFEFIRSFRLLGALTRLSWPALTIKRVREASIKNLAIDSGKFEIHKYQGSQKARHRETIISCCPDEHRKWVVPKITRTIMHRFVLGEQFSTCLCFASHTAATLRAEGVRLFSPYSFYELKERESEKRKSLTFGILSPRVSGYAFVIVGFVGSENDCDKF